ncbi:MAG: ribosome maturation factor RimP [Candidatus Puniceispirillaceae bacterium]
MASVTDRIADMIRPALTEMGFDLVRVYYSGIPGAGRHHLQIMAEPFEAREMTVQDCQKISKYLAALLDVEDPIKDAYDLEVSSPGIDRPLTRPYDYDRFAGDLAKVHLKKMVDGRKRIKGRITGRDEDGKIILETSFGQLVFGFDEIDSAKIDPTEYFENPDKKAPPVMVTPEQLSKTTTKAD